MSTTGSFTQYDFENPGFRENYIMKLFQTKWFRATLILHFKRLKEKLGDMEKMIKSGLMELIPVRSGKLLDTILSTMKIEMIHSNEDGMYFDLTYNHAVRRPDPIWGRVKHGVIATGKREFGRGEDYIPTHNIPNVRRASRMMQITSKKTTHGNVNNTILYELDDPLARSEIIETVTKLYIGAFVIEFEKLFKKIPVVGTTLKIGEISGVITQSENMERYLRGEIE